MRVVSQASGRFILCAWTECDRYADHKYEHTHREGTRNATYGFCSERHRELWRHSSRSHGNLPTGSKGMIT